MFQGGTHPLGSITLYGDLMRQANVPTKSGSRFEHTEGEPKGFMDFKRDFARG